MFRTTGRRVSTASPAGVSFNAAVAPSCSTSPGSLKHQRVDAELIGTGNTQRQARVFVRHRPAHASRDAGKQIADVQLRYQCIGDLEQHLQTVALRASCRWYFSTFSKFSVLSTATATWAATCCMKSSLRFSRRRGSEAEHQRSQPMLRGGERQPAGCDDVVAAQQLHHRRPARFRSHIGNHQRFLMQEHPSGRRLLGCEFQFGGAWAAGPTVDSRMCKRMVLVRGSCSTRFRKSKRRTELRRAGKVAKKPRQIAMLQDSLRDIQERLIGNGFQLKTSIGCAACA